VNKSKSILVLAFAAAAGFSGSALAQSQELGAYVGLSIGQSKANDFDCAGLASCDKKDTAWKILGGYQFNRYIAAEAAYTNLGKVKAGDDAGSSLEIKANALELVAVGSYPIGTSGFAPYGKFGIYRGEAKTNVNVVGLGSFSAKETTTDWTLGIGVRYDVMRNFAVRAEWQRYNGLNGGNLGGVDVGDSAIDVISIGALYKF